MKEQDRRAGEGMARSGMDLDLLISCFPGFPKDEITKVYHEIQRVLHGFDDKPAFKMNCS